MQVKPTMLLLLCFLFGFGGVLVGALGGAVWFFVLGVGGLVVVVVVVGRMAVVRVRGW